MSVVHALEKQYNRVHFHLLMLSATLDVCLMDMDFGPYKKYFTSKIFGFIKNI